MISSKKSPDKSDRLPASNPSMQTLDLLMMRRSLTVKDMRDPGPSEEQLNQLLTIGSRVPDHKKQVPWRFLTFAGTAAAAETGIAGIGHFGLAVTDLQASKKFF